MLITLPDKHVIDMVNLVSIMKDANIIALGLYQEYLTKDDLAINFKNDNNYISPVTNADLIVNNYIIQQLFELHPDIPIMSEENKEIPYLIRKENEIYWCIDPIDGTKEFINKNGEFTINIGLVYNNKPVIGIVGYPVNDIIYYAAKDKGAYKIMNKLTIPLMTRVRNKPVTIICSRSHSNMETKRFLEHFVDYQKISRGSSLKFMAVAEGLADIYPRLVGCMEWDTCASHIIVTEAGGRIELYNNPKETLTYNKETLLNPYFVVYGE